jgi:hypothetical protein
MRRKRVHAPQLFVFPRVHEPQLASKTGRNDAVGGDQAVCHGGLAVVNVGKHAQIPDPVRGVFWGGKARGGFLFRGTQTRTRLQSALPGKTQQHQPPNIILCELR